MLVSRFAVVCWMATGCIRKLKAPVVKQKSFGLERKAWRFFQVDQERGLMDYLSLCWRENRAADSNFSEKMASRSRSFETAMSSLDFIHKKLQQTPENPPKMTKYAKWTTETRQGEYIFLNFIEKSNILFHHKILSFVILNSIQCLVEHLNSQSTE